MIKPKFNLTVFAVAALTACGGSSSGDGIIRRSDLSWSNPFAGTADETVTLSVWAGNTTESIAYTKAVAEDFKKANPNSNYTINIKAISERSVNGDWANDPKQAADFAVVPDDQLPSLIANNYLQKLSVMDYEIEGLTESLKTRNTADSVEVVTSKNDLYGFPVSASNGYVLYYNTEFLTKEDCASFDSLLAAIHRVSERDGKNYTFGFEHASGWYLDGWFHGAGFSASGEADGNTIDADWNDAVDGVEGLEVASALVKLAHGQYKQHWLSEKEVNLMARTAKNLPNRVIAVINGTWNYNSLRKNWGEANTSATILPTYTVHDSAGAAKQVRMQTVKGFKVGVVNRSSKNVKAATRFAEFYSNYSSQVMRFDNLSEAPTNIESNAVCDYNTNACLKAAKEQREIGGFVEKVNASFWNPSNDLSAQLCAGNAGNDKPFIVSGEGTADLVLNEDNIQEALDKCIAAFERGA